VVNSLPIIPGPKLSSHRGPWLVIWATECVPTIPEFMQFDCLDQVDGMMIRYISLYSRQTGEGRDSSVGVATGYGLEDPETESRWELEFPHPSSPALEPTQPPIQGGPGLSGV